MSASISEVNWSLCAAGSLAKAYTQIIKKETEGQNYSASNLEEEIRYVRKNRTKATSLIALTLGMPADPYLREGRTSTLHSFKLWDVHHSRRRDGTVLDRMQRICVAIWETGEWPEELKFSTFIPLHWLSILSVGAGLPMSSSLSWLTVAVSDDSVSVKGTPLSDVTGSDTRLHWSRSEKTSSRLDAKPSHTEVDEAQSSDAFISVLM